MALINCPECGKEVSERAHACPNCGFPISEMKVEEETQNIDIMSQLNIGIGNMHTLVEQYMNTHPGISGRLSEILPDVANEIEKIRKMYDGHSDEEIKKCEDRIAKAILYVEKTGHSKCSWQTIKAFYELVRFDLISNETIEKIGTYVYVKISKSERYADGSIGNSEHIMYWYVIHMLLTYGNGKVIDMIRANLSFLNAFGKPKMTDIENNVNQHLYEDSAKLEAIEVERRKSKGNSGVNIGAATPVYHQPQPNVPRCPTCSSTNVKRISGVSKIVSTEVFGLASNTIGKTFKCNSCGYMW